MTAEQREENEPLLAERLESGGERQREDAEELAKHIDVKRSLLRRRSSVEFKIDKPLDYKAILGACAGNVLEFFDFSLFGYFADIIGKNFFDGGDEHHQLLMSFSVFAAGGILLGMLGDATGRVVALRLSIALMAIPTFLLGCLPPYSMIGIWATVGLIFIRICQGLSAGGELVGSAIYLVERADRKSRGVASSYVGASMVFGCFLGCAFGALMRGICTNEQLETWGFRVPFLSGIVLAGVGLYLQNDIEETLDADFQNTESKVTQAIYCDACRPVEESFHTNLRQMLETVFMLAWPHSGFYVFFVWLPIFFEKIRPGHVPYVMLLNCGILLIHLAAMLAFGHASRIVSDRVILLYGTGAVSLLAVPLFLAFAHGGLGLILGAWIFIAIAQASVGALQYSWCVHHFRLWRFTSLGMAYNVASSIFGGSVPVILTAATKFPPLGLATPSLWVLFLCFLTVITLLIVGKQNYQTPYDDDISKAGLDSAPSGLGPNVSTVSIEGRTVERTLTRKSSNQSLPNDLRE